MAYLGVITAHTVNGVAAIHSDILREDLFREFAELWPDKFTNVTNGVTQRRWLAFCNEPLRELISERLGSEAWIRCRTLTPSATRALPHRPQNSPCAVVTGLQPARPGGPRTQLPCVGRASMVRLRVRAGVCVCALCKAHARAGWE